MKTYIFIPPVKRPVGGVAVLYQIASHLSSAGFEVFLVPREGHGPSRPQGAESLPEVRWRDLALGGEDLWLAPEGWVNALAPGLKAGARCLVYCQNWAYLFSALPAEVDWRMLKVSFLAVSQPVAWFIEKTTGARCPICGPGWTSPFSGRRIKSRPGLSASPTCPARTRSWSSRSR